MNEGFVRALLPHSFISKKTELAVSFLKQQLPWKLATWQEAENKIFYFLFHVILTPRYVFWWIITRYHYHFTIISMTSHPKTQTDSAPTFWYRIGTILRWCPRHRLSTISTHNLQTNFYFSICRLRVVCCALCVVHVCRNTYSTIVCRWMITSLAGAFQN